MRESATQECAVTVSASSAKVTRIRVAFFLPSLNGGGAERAAVNLLRGLDKNRFHPTLILKRKEGSLLNEMPDDIEIIELDTDSYRGVLISSWLLRRVLRDVRPQLVVSFLNQCNVCALLAGALSLRRYKLIISVRNSLKAKFSNRSKPKRILKELFVKRVYGQADHIISVSDGVANELVEKFNLLRSKITTIHNPLDVKRIRRLSKANAPVREWAGKEKVIVAAGRLVQQKGFSDLIEALAIIRRSTPAKLIILGDGPLKGKLKGLADDLGVAQSVLLPGFVENPWAWISKSDVFVLSSHWEGLPAVLIEAMACGVPIVATDCDFGPREYVDPGVHGYLIQPGDIQGLASTVKAVLGDPLTSVQFVKNGLERAMQFESSKACQNFERVFERIVGGAS